MNSIVNRIYIADNLTNHSISTKKLSDKKQNLVLKAIWEQKKVKESRKRKKSFSKIDDRTFELVD